MKYDARTIRRWSDWLRGHPPSGLALRAVDKRPQGDIEYVLVGTVDGKAVKVGRRRLLLFDARQFGARICERASKARPEWIDKGLHIV